MNRRVIGLVVAVLLAAVATVAIYMYVTRADERAAEEFELRQVYVATQRIEAGTPADVAISQALIERRDLPETAVAEGAIGSLEQLEGLVAVAPIVPGQQIVTASFGDQAQVPTGTGSDIEVPEGLQAVAVDLSVVPGVAGFVDAGDRISILSVIDAEAGAAPEAQPEPDPDSTEPPPPPPPATVAEGLQARYVVQNALVLAIGQRVTTYDEDGNATGKGIQESNDNFIFTLALTPVEVEKLVFAETQSTLWATLLPPVEEGEDGEEPAFEPADTPGANADNLFE